MRKILCMLLAGMLLGLCACSKSPQTATTEPNTTTKPATTTAVLPEPTTEPSPPAETEHVRMGTAEVYEKPSGKYNTNEIWMREESGEETLLLGFDEDDTLVPYFIAAVDDRYFLYLLAIMDSDGFSPPILYDIQEKQTIRIEFPNDSRGDFELLIGSKVYMAAVSGGWGYEGVVRLSIFCANIAALAKGEPVVAKDLLQGVPEYDALSDSMAECDDPQYGLSPDARYFAIHVPNSSPTLYVFDIAQRKLLLQQEQADLAELSFADAKTLTWLEQGAQREITLA